MARIRKYNWGGPLGGKPFMLFPCPMHSLEKKHPGKSNPNNVGVGCLMANGKK